VHLVHGARPEIVERNHAGNDRGERRGDQGIAVVGDVMFTSDYKVSDVRLERFTHLGGGAGKIDEHAAGIDYVDREALRLKPSSDGVQVLLRYSVLLAELLCGDPLVEIGGARRVKFVDELFHRLLLLGGAVQQEQHVLHREVAGDGAAIIFKYGFRAGVAVKRDALFVVDILRHEDAGVQTRFHLR